MGKATFIILAIIFFLGVIKTTGITRLIWFFTGVIFFQDRIILFTTPTIMSFTRFMIFTLIFAEALHPKKLFHNLKTIPIAKPLLIVLLSMICIAVMDRRHNIFLNTYRAIDEYLQSFFVIFLCYTNFRKTIDWEKLIKFLFISAAILCVYGIYNFLTKSNPYDSFITNQYNIASSFDQYIQGPGERFRVNSFVSHPIYFGYLTGILLLLSLYCLFYLRKFRLISLSIIPLLFINIILSNSRTPFIAFLVGLAALVSIGFSRRNKMKFLIFSIIICIASYPIPLVRNNVNTVVDIVKTGGNKTSGSNLEMRTTQLAASYNVFLKNPLFGNGFYYINENLGWDKDPLNRTSDDDFEGFESYIYHLLIEQGIIGIVSNIVFFTSIGVYFLKKRIEVKELSALGFSILLAFLTFIIGTGTVNSWVISMGLLGILIKNISLKYKALLPKPTFDNFVKRRI